MSTAPPIPVGVVDPRPLVRDRLRAVLAGDARFTVVGAHPGWADVPADSSPGVVWVCAGTAGGPGCRRVDVADLDVTDSAAIGDRVAAAVGTAGQAPAGPAGAVRLLSPRESAVLDGVARGRSAAETAQALALTRKSVEQARRRAMAKLGAGTQVEAVRRAHQLRTAGVPLTRAEADRDRG